MRASPALLLALLLPSAALGQAQPFTSFRRLVTSNGYAPSVIDLEARRLTIFRENMYRFPEPGSETRNLAFDLYLGLRSGGQSRWLTDVRLDEAAYETGTNIIRTVQRSGGLRVTTSWLAPMGLEERALLVVAEVTNEGAEASDVALFSIHNFHLGGGTDRTSEEHIRWDPGLGAYLESSSHTGAARGVLVIKPLTPAARHAASPSNPFPLVASHQLLPDVDDSGVRDDAVSGFQFDVAGRGRFASGATEYFALIVSWSPDRDAARAVAAIDAYHRGRSPQQLLDDERQDWRRWHRAGLWPVTESSDEQRVSEQALAILRTGQVREPGAPNGQILASLPPGMWDIAWVRDGMFAIEALTATGHHTEAEAALEFFIRGPFGDYQAYIGRPYGLSVVRHFGNGREESDVNANGPNIELDGFGMYLAAAARHARTAPGGAAWLMRRRAHIDPLIADVLVAYRDQETGLVGADSSIWESHWDNGGRQRWVFTSGYAVIGLRAWAEALELFGGVPDDPRVAAYRQRADEILAAMRTHLVDPQTGALASSVEQLRRGDGRFADGQAALILGPRSIGADEPTGLATLDFLRERLFLSATTRRGYKRNDDGDAYDEREWSVIDLGISRQLRSAGRTIEADALVDWITAQAAANFLLVPELLDQNDARYTGEVPMIGFGAGAYLTTLIDRSGTTAPGVPAPEDAGTTADAGADEDGSALTDAEPTPDAASGADAGQSTSSDARTVLDAGQQQTRPEPACGCAATNGGSASWLAIAIGALLLRGRASRPARPGRRRPR